MEIEGRKYCVGDSAYFQPDQSGNSPYVGKILSMWQKKGSTGIECMELSVLWFYRPENISPEKIAFHKPHSQELYLSKVVDKNSMQSIVGKCNVLSFSEFNLACEGSDIPVVDTYFCQYLYDGTSIYPIRSTTQNGHIEVGDMEISDESILIGIEELCSSRRKVTSNKKIQITNWPLEVSYIRSIVGGENLSTNAKTALQIAEDKHKLLVTIQMIEEKHHPSFGKFGLFALEDIEKYKVIGEFTGTLQVVNAHQFRSKQYSVLLCQTSSFYVIVDAEKQGNEFRFINNCSTREQKANVRFEPTFLNGDWHILVIATEKILQGQELPVS